MRKKSCCTRRQGSLQRAECEEAAHIKELQTEYAKLLADKKTAYAEYRQARAAMRELLTVKNNVDRVLAMEQTEPQQKEKDHGQR